MPLLVFVWLLVLLADEPRGGIFEAFLNLEQVQMSSVQVMAKTVGAWHPAVFASICLEPDTIGPTIGL